VHTNDVAQIAVPPENREEHVVKFVERHQIGDRDQADDHRAHLAQNRSQNQAFEGGCFNHLSRLLGSPDPRLFGALLVGPSGSGKSSVVQAGLIPLLRRERPPANTWDAVSFTPGDDPFFAVKFVRSRSIKGWMGRSL
jgi:hypothetical protein